jgi:arylsulfatase A-like enzyme
MTFTDAHSGSSVCTPTRYGLLTGRYAWRTRLPSGVLDGTDDPPLIAAGQLQNT